MSSENKTPNLELNQWSGNEYPKRTDFVEDNKKIDEAYKELKDSIKDGGKVSSVNSKIGDVILKAEDIKTQAGITVENKLNELFQFADNGKKNIASVIGSPLSSSDTFDSMKSKIQTLKNTFASNLTSKGQSSNGSDTLNNLINKIPNINTGKKWAEGTGKIGYPDDGSGISQKTDISNLQFTPSIVFGYYGSELQPYTFFINKGEVSSEGVYVISTVANADRHSSAYTNKYNPFDIVIKPNGFVFSMNGPSRNIKWYAYE